MYLTCVLCFDIFRPQSFICAVSKSTTAIYTIHEQIHDEGNGGEKVVEIHMVAIYRVIFTG